MHLFTRLPIAVSSAMPIIPAEDIEFFPDYETDPYEHWIFDKGGVAGLVGKVNGRVLTPQASAPAYSSNFLSLPKQRGNALRSDKPDGREQTMCIVYRQTTSTQSLCLAGAKGGTGALGSMMMSVTSLGGLFGTSHPGTTKVLNGPIAEVSDAWVFAAYSESALLGSTTGVLMRGGAAPQILTGGTLKALGGPVVSLGDALYAATATGSFNFAEFILYDKGLSAEELAGVYARSKTRLAKRGISIV